MKEKVSIIIPVYNVENYLPECLDSVCKQTYDNLEIILVDDGSTDLSGEICDRYAKSDKRIVVIHQENSGAAIAKNKGLDRVTGEYVAFVDSDDYVEQYWIEEMLSNMNNQFSDIVECNFDKVFLNTIEAGNSISYTSQLFEIKDYMKQYLDVWTSSLFCNKLFKTSLTKDIRFRNERRCIDDEFYTYKVILKGKKIYRNAKILYHYRQRESSAVNDMKNELQKTEDALEILIERYIWIKEYIPELKKLYLRHDIDIMLYFANNFVFDDITVKNFQRIAQFYLRECVRCFPGIITIRILIQVLLKRPQDLLGNVPLEKKNDNKLFYK